MRDRDLEKKSAQRAKKCFDKDCTQALETRQPLRFERFQEKTQVRENKYKQHKKECKKIIGGSSKTNRRRLYKKFSFIYYVI